MQNSLQRPHLTPVSSFELLCTLLSKWWHWVNEKVCNLTKAVLQAGEWLQEDGNPGLLKFKARGNTLSHSAVWAGGEEGRCVLLGILRCLLGMCLLFRFLTVCFAPNCSLKTVTHPQMEQGWISVLFILHCPVTPVWLQRYCDKTRETDTKKCIGLFFGASETH